MLDTRQPFVAVSDYRNGKVCWALSGGRGKSLTAISGSPSEGALFLPIPDTPLATRKDSLAAMQKTAMLKL
ncbi:MAG: hypothetical protein JNM98_16545 [Rhodocyclaceae bacterium]|nr:hypothetical protein [Rhodocyclaceae bacterium]